MKIRDLINLVDDEAAVCIFDKFKQYGCLASIDCPGEQEDDDGYIYLPCDECRNHYTECVENVLFNGKTSEVPIKLSEMKIKKIDIFSHEVAVARKRKKERRLLLGIEVDADED